MSGDGMENLWMEDSRGEQEILKLRVEVAGLRADLEDANMWVEELKGHIVVLEATCKCVGGIDE